MQREGLLRSARVLLFITSLVANSSLGRSVLPATLLSVPCREAIVSRLDHWDSLHQWRLDTSEGDDTIYRSPTKRLGVWIELRLHGSESAEALRIAAEEVVEARWIGKSCRLETTIGLQRADRDALKASFTDADLRAVVEKYPAGIIYAWSPHMPLSIKALHYARAAAKTLKLPLIEVLDPHADSRFARHEALRTGIGSVPSKRMESIELFFRGMPQHYPSMVVFAGKRIVGSTVPGLKSPDNYVQLIRNRIIAKEEP